MANTLNITELRKRAELAGKSDAITESLMRAIGILSVSGAKEGFTTQTAPDGTPWLKLKHPRPDGGGQVLSDKGLLKNSIQVRTFKERIELYASHPAANVFQYGAEIRPVRGKALAIPLTREAKRIGSPRQNRFPRKLFILKTKRGKAFLVEKDKGELVWHYILVRGVRIEKREFLGWSEKTLVKIEALAAMKLMDRIVDAFSTGVIRA